MTGHTEVKVVHLESHGGEFSDLAKVKSMRKAIRVRIGSKVSKKPEQEANQRSSQRHTIIK